MQTFLPYPDFCRSLSCLDSRRLGKQRVEAMQILNTLLRGTKAWSNHPAVLMWKGYEAALAEYMNIAILEWVHRGYHNTMSEASLGKVTLPWWLGWPQFHASHRSNLLRKDYTFYRKYGWREEPNKEYTWPTTKRC